MGPRSPEPILNNVCAIGVDLEDIARFKKNINNERFMAKIFTEKEIKYCKRFSSPESHLAARFAGKEAVFKALNGRDAANGDVLFSDIEILNHKNGSPYVNMKRKHLKNRFNYFISLAHTKRSAVAFSVIGEK